MTITEKLNAFIENNEHGKILKKISDGELTYRNCINEWVDNVQAPILHEALAHESGFFYRDVPSGLEVKKVRTFDSGKLMMRHPKIYHPLLHPSIPNLVTAFYLDDCPLIYCNSNYGEKDNTKTDFQPYETVFTDEWIKVVERNKRKFVLSPADMEWRGYENELGTWSHLKTAILSFETEKDLFLTKEEN